MKRLVSAFLSAIFALVPVVSFADSTQGAQKLTVSGNNAIQGSLTATNLNPIFVSLISGEQIRMAGNGNGPFEFVINTNQSLLAAPAPGAAGPVFVQITGFAIQCLPYIPALASTTGYPYFTAQGGPETAGVFGGIITFTEYKRTGSPVTIGTLTLPDSPHNGPYINTASVRLSSPYTPFTGSVIGAYILSPTSSYDYMDCIVSATLQ